VQAAIAQLIEIDAMKLEEEELDSSTSVGQGFTQGIDKRLSCLEEVTIGQAAR